MQQIDQATGKKEGNLTESVYRKLRGELVLCRIAPGSRMKTSELAKRYGVSLASIREAMARLTSEDLVSYEPQRGFVAAPISAQRLQDLTAVRVEVETMALKQSLAHFSALDDIRLDEAMEAMIATAVGDAEGNHRLTEDWIAAHAAFHDALVAGCTNQVLLQVRRQLFDQSERYRALAAQVYLAKKVTDIAADHLPIAEAVQQRDTSRAVELLRLHVTETTDSLLRSRVGGQALVPRSA
jgi:Transcriptional regulators